jgi:hypothetical protein
MNEDAHYPNSSMYKTVAEKRKGKFHHIDIAWNKVGPTHIHIFRRQT